MAVAVAVGVALRLLWYFLGFRPLSSVAFGPQLLVLSFGSEAMSTWQQNIVGTWASTSRVGCLLVLTGELAPAHPPPLSRHRLHPPLPFLSLLSFPHLLHPPRLASPLFPCPPSCPPPFSPLRSHLLASLVCWKTLLSSACGRCTLVRGSRPVGREKGVSRLTMASPAPRRTRFTCGTPWLDHD